MKKLNGKFIVSALLAAALVSMSSVTAGATEYANPHRQGGIIGGDITPTSGGGIVDDRTETTGGSSKGDVQGTDDEEENEAGTEDEPVSTVSDEIVGGLADGEEATVYVEPASNGSITVKKDAIGEIKNSGAVVTFVNESDGYTITIDPESITDVKAIDLAMDVSVAGKNGETENGVDIPAGAIIIAPKQSGDFGMTLKVTLTAESLKELGINMNNLKLYYISDDGKVTDMTSALTVENGSVSILISHASEYVITDTVIEADFVEEAPEATEEEGEEDEGEADYQIIIDVPIAEGDDEVADETPIDDEGTDEGTDEADADINVDDASAEGTSSAAPASEDKGKTETPSSDEGGLIVDAGSDSNPVTGTEIVFGTLAVTAVSALAIAATSKKRK